MRLEPKDFFEKLEFDKVVDLLAKECLGELGQAAIRELRPMTNLGAIQEKLQEVAAFKLSLEQNDRIPLKTYSDIAADLHLLSIAESVLPEEGLRRINVTLQTVGEIYRFFTPARKELYAPLYNIIRNTDFDSNLVREIDRVIDKEGNIRPDASPELARIYKVIQSKMRELDKVFRDLANEYRNKGWLSDSVESFRNGRRVLSVPVEHKRKIRGIIHDESATGRTAYIEPEPVIEINNDLFDLEQQQRREIYRILKELSAVLRPYVPVIEQYQEFMVIFDQIQSKARLALRIKGVAPLLNDEPKFDIREGYHPLLLLRNQAQSRKTIPFTLHLDDKNRILLLSGPNAGGKSITMKSVGLLQLMVQSGLLIPVDKRSELGIFYNFFADIGDQQSIEDDLSTYSSRLRNMRIFLDHADERTLVLIDEFGSGTDPQIGGAIAEAILWELNYRKVVGVITTHYSNLKIFAFKSKGILNGSMVFDSDNLAPTYELKPGRPGSSYAFEIAEKSGLSKKVMDYAKNRIGKNDKAVDQLLVDLQREKQETEERLQELKNKQDNLDRLIKTYDTMQRDLEFRRKKQKLEVKEQAMQSNAQENKDLERLVRELRETRNLEAAVEAANKAREEKKKLAEEVVQLREEVIYNPAGAKPDRPIKKGDSVRIKAGGATGVVEAIKGEKAIVEMGLMRMTIPLRDLQPISPTMDLRAGKSVSMDTVEKNATFYPRLDIRGARYDEALRMVEDFMDQALMTSSNHLQIVHGKGNGTLRKVVKDKLREYNVEMEIRHPEPESGGDGVTLIEFI
jgi:DNA mismatch repair protein MutS2